jgi:hypothetical protein
MVLLGNLNLLNRSLLSAFAIKISATKLSNNLCKFLILKPSRKCVLRGYKNWIYAFYWVLLFLNYLIAVFPNNAYAAVDVKSQNHCSIFSFHKPFIKIIFLSDHYKLIVTYIDSTWGGGGRYELKRHLMYPLKDFVRSFDKKVKCDKILT